MEEKITVNDGRGLMDNTGLINSLIEDCDSLISYLFTGQRILFCSQIVQMVQKLGRLREGVKNDLEDRDRQIKELHEILDGGGANVVEH